MKLLYFISLFVVVLSCTDCRCDVCAKEGGQCGGPGWAMEKCCRRGLECKKEQDGYAYCVKHEQSSSVKPTTTHHHSHTHHSTTFRSRTTHFPKPTVTTRHHTTTHPPATTTKHHTTAHPPATTTKKPTTSSSKPIVVTTTKKTTTSTPTATNLCTAQLNQRRLKYRNISTPLIWNQQFANRALQVANPWIGHWGLGAGPGGFVGGQIWAGVSSCDEAMSMWVEGEMSSPGVCQPGITHCGIILDFGYTIVGCAESGPSIVCNFG
ncbi:hypothetical protein HK103_002916 [Boothiomyces macroporosus]|uniref:CBM1 domain-containing protein n=1 Tax=Boothiomyces macroporosus TaxID=261099 RepID=A0AAD5U941_9FUNG|nr:hypothetical protein HK103_002916 [Boothiomyces macroporosus]